MYVKPLTSWSDGGNGPDLSSIRPRQPDLANLASFASDVFDWKTPGDVIANFGSVLWAGVCFRMLLEVSYGFICSASAVSFRCSSHAESPMSRTMLAFRLKLSALSLTAVLDLSPPRQCTRTPFRYSHHPSRRPFGREWHAIRNHPVCCLATLARAIRCCQRPKKFLGLFI
jgi:hypothetical protein